MCKKQGGTLPYALLILLQSVLYGFGNPLSKIGFESITVLWCLGIRFSGAAALMGSMLKLHPKIVVRDGTVTGWLVVAYLALLCTCLSYVLQNTALTLLSSYAVSLLQCTQPILTAACSYLLLGGEAVGDRTGGSGAYRGLWCWKTGRAAENKPHKDKRTFLFERPLIFL